MSDKLPVTLCGSRFSDFGKWKSQIQKTRNLCFNYLSGSERLQIQPQFETSATKSTVAWNLLFSIRHFLQWFPPLVFRNRFVEHPGLHWVRKFLFTWKYGRYSPIFFQLLDLWRFTQFLVQIGKYFKSYYCLIIDWLSTLIIIYLITNKLHWINIINNFNLYLIIFYYLYYFFNFI